MKHTLLKIIALVLFIVISRITFAQDIIVTTDSRKIEAKITEVSKSEIRYKEPDNLDGPTFVLGADEINTIIYANGKVVLYGNHEKSQEENNIVLPVENIDEGTIEILLLTGEKIYAQIKDLGKDILSYYALDGSYHTMATSRVEKVTFLKNGQVKTYNEKPIVHEAPVLPAVQTQANAIKDIDIARVDNFSGVYVFSDCVPIAPYEVLGEVSNSSTDDSGFFYSSGGIGLGFLMMDCGSIPQYNEIRYQLIASAVLANRQVEGIIITISQEGVGRAKLIKFKEDVKDKSLARVNSHMGVLVFTDCMPLNTYSYVGKVEKAGGMSSDYNNLLDRMIKKAQKKFPSVQGIIPRFVTNGSDTAEAIKF